MAEALKYPKYPQPLPMNEVVELRMPLRVYDEALAALAAVADELAELRQTVNEWAAEAGQEAVRRHETEEALAAAREALERLVADLETNSEAGAPLYAHNALAGSVAATPGKPTT